MSNKKRETVEFSVDGPDLVAKVKALIHEGNVRRVVVKRDDRVVLDLPLTFAAASIIFAPQLALLGVILAFSRSAKTSILVERVVQDE